MCAAALLPGSQKLLLPGTLSLSFEERGAGVRVCGARATFPKGKPAIPRALHAIPRSAKRSSRCDSARHFRNVAPIAIVDARPAPELVSCGNHAQQAQQVAALQAGARAHARAAWLAQRAAGMLHLPLQPAHAAALQVHTPSG